MTFYRRHLPHWQPDGATFFITWRLAGSLPKGVLQQLNFQHEEWREISERAKRLNTATPQRLAGRRFLIIDRALDKAAHGPRWLANSQIAELAAKAIRAGAVEKGSYSLFSFVIMPNHVHLLIKPKEPLKKITRVLKGFTAWQANKILNQTGQEFWQSESFDHWVRDEPELQRLVTYIEANPVKAGLAGSPSEWPWSSAAGRTVL